MNKIAIVTDSNSGISQEEAKKLGVYVIPMLFYINDKEYIEGVSINDDEFFDYQINGADIKTSQPIAGNIIETWDEILKEYESIVYIPMTKSLSGSYGTAQSISQDYEGKVFVIDNQRISVSQLQSVLDAKKMVEEGYSAIEIKDFLEKDALNSSIYLTVDTLSYLKKGGRITPAAATIGDLLNMKPVLQIQGGLIDIYKKVRGKNKAKQTMIEAIREDLNGRFSELAKIRKPQLRIAHAGTYDEAIEWKKEIEQEFQDIEISIDKLSLNICTHVGKGTIGIALMFPFEK